MKKNWLSTGGLVKVTDNEIIYTSKVEKNTLGVDQIISGFVNSNIEFENGTIEFTTKLNDRNALCQLILNTDTGNDLNIGFNTAGILYGIIKLNKKTNNWDLLSGIGTPETFDISNEYKVKIEVIGSLITLSINGINVASAIHHIRKGQIQIAFSSEKKITVKDIVVKARKPKAFIVMQFSEEYNQLYQEVIKPVCEKFGLECERADEFYTATPIIKDIINSIKVSSVIIAEITPDNPNVFYEVGYAHAIEKPTILLCDRKREKLPFDISGFRTLFYENSIAGKSAVEKNLQKFLENIF